MLRFNPRLALSSVALLSSLTGIAVAEDIVQVLGTEDVPPASACTGSNTAASSPGVTIGTGGPWGPDSVVVPAHIEAVELVSAEWGVMPAQYVDSFLQYDGGQFLWKRKREAPEGGQLAPGAVNWQGVDDGGQDMPQKTGNATVALYKYVIKSSSEKKKSIKRMAMAEVKAEANATWASGSVNAKVEASVDTESEFEHSIGQKVNLAIQIKCAAYKLDAQGQNPEEAILYFGPSNVQRELPLSIKDAEGKPKTIKWNPIAVDAEFSADNAATNANAISCWYKYTGDIEKGELTNTEWTTKGGLGAQVGVSNGWRVWKFTADISVEGKAAAEWHSLDKTSFTKESFAAWSLKSNKYWLLPNPPTDKQREDFQIPCRDNKDPVACAAWDNIKAAYMSEIMKVKGENGATEHGANFWMAEWQNAMLGGSFRKVGDWLDSTNFFQLAELQALGIECTITGFVLRDYGSWWYSNTLWRLKGPLFGVSDKRCNVQDIFKLIDTTTKVGKIEAAVLDKANKDMRSDRNWIRSNDWDKYKCAHRDWDWDVVGKYPFPYWFYAQEMGWAMDKQPKNKLFPNSTEYICHGCEAVGSSTCVY